MRIDKKDIDVALIKTGETAARMDISFDQKNIDDFRRKINFLKDKGDIFSDINFIKLQSAFRNATNDAVKSFLDLTNMSRKITNIERYVAATADHLFAHMMKALDCIEIPKDKFMLFQNDLSYLAEQLFKARPDTLESTKEFFDAQRGKNASVLSTEISDMMDNLRNSVPISTEALGKVYGEYQALYMRQLNHGSVWRFFHSSENQKRLDLLQNMKETLEKHIPEEMLVPTERTPSEIAKYGEKLNIQQGLKRYLTTRESDPAKYMGYNNYKIDKDEKNAKTEKIEKIEPKKEIASVSIKSNQSIKDCIKFLKVTYRPNMQDLEGEQELMQQLLNAINRKQIFAEDTKRNKIIKELVYRNYLRLGTAEHMDTNPKERLKYYAMQDSDFMNEHLDYTPPSKMPELTESKPVINEKKLEVSEEIKANSEEEDERDFMDKLKQDTSESNVAKEENLHDAPVISTSVKSLN